jgi:hypothetical protein
MCKPLIPRSKVERAAAHLAEVKAELRALNARRSARQIEAARRLAAPAWRKNVRAAIVALDNALDVEF